MPLGWEHDRAVLPLEKMKAHRIHALVWRSEPRRERYLTKFRVWARKRNVEFTVHEVDSFHSLSAVMRTVSKIIVDELAAGNRIYINVSTSGKIAAIGATLAAMAHLPPSRGQVYAVVALDYPTTKDAQRVHGIAKGMWGDPLPVPIFPLSLPDQDCRFVLAELANAGKSLSYSELALRLRGAGFAPYGDAAQLAVNRVARTRLQVAFHRRIVAKLSASGMAVVEKTGRERKLALTPAGTQFAALCAL